MILNYKLKNFINNIIEESARRGVIIGILGILINYLTNTISLRLGLSTPLNSVGTIITGILAGPLIGGLTGLLTNIIQMYTTNPLAGWYSITNMSLGITSGILFQKKWLTKKSGLKDVLATIGMLSIIATIISAPINIYVYTNTPLNNMLEAVFLGAKNVSGILPALTGPELLHHLMDMTITIVFAYLIMIKIPNKYFTNYFTRGKKRK